MYVDGIRPLRDLQDIAKRECFLLEQRLLSWDASDWIRRGLDLNPGEIAIRCINNGDPTRNAVAISNADRKRRIT